MNKTAVSHHSEKKKRPQSLGKKLIGATILLLVVQYIILSVKDWQSITKFSNDQIKIIGDLKYSAFNNEINTYTLMGNIILDNVTSDKNIVKAFAERDRKTLLQLTAPLFVTMKEKYHAQQFHFHTPPATSFLRVQRPSKFGDDLSSFRATVVKANSEKRKFTVSKQA